MNSTSPIRAILLLLSFYILSGFTASSGYAKESRTVPIPETISYYKPPNILIIVADDLGYSDLAAFGGEIHSPNLDDLANRGTRFTNFHAAPTCSPTRAMLLTGVDHHRAGLGNMHFSLRPEQKGQPGYEGHLNSEVVTVASLLKSHGYHTYMSGKWHLGQTIETGPESRGFDEVLVMPNGAADHFGQKVVVGTNPKSVGSQEYRENGMPITIPDDFYSSRFYTDKLIEYIDGNRGDGRPFFAYLAYTAPHWPLQVPEEFIERYEGIYDIGYDRIRDERIVRMKRLGVIESEVLAHDGLNLWPEWSELTQQQKVKEARRMQIYAGMVEAMDFHIGRLVTYLKELGELENTFILFMSDNGAEGNDPFLLGNNEEWIPSNFDNSLSNMGKANSYVAYGPRWAEVSSAPYSTYKGYTGQGGILVPAIVFYPKISGSNRISREVATVLDVVPTLLDLSGILHHGTLYKESQKIELDGKSMLPHLLDGKSRIHSDRDSVGWELFNRRALRQGSWKIVWNEHPFGTGGWELYNLESDPTELRNLAHANPGKLQKMVLQWESYAKKNGVILVPPTERYINENTHFYH